MEEDELVVGVGGFLELFDEGGTAVFDYHVFEAENGGEDGFFEDIVFGFDYDAVTTPVVELVLGAKEIGGEDGDILVFT